MAGMIPMSARLAASAAAHCDGIVYSISKSLAAVAVLEVPHQRSRIQEGDGGDTKAGHERSSLTKQSQAGSADGSKTRITFRVWSDDPTRL